MTIFEFLNHNKVTFFSARTSLNFSNFPCQVKHMNSFSEELASYWLLTHLHHKFFPMKIGSLHWNGAAETCKGQLWWKVAGEYQI